MDDELENIAKEIETRFKNGFVTSKQARAEIVSMLKTFRSKMLKGDKNRSAK